MELWEGTWVIHRGMLTGDFLAPYLLSSIDMGVGMMKMLAPQLPATARQISPCP